MQNSPTAPDETGESPRKGTKMIKDICGVEDCQNETLTTTKLKDDVKVKFCLDCVTDLYKFATFQLWDDCKTVIVK